jgi:putative polyhydroxyalkanoate system protein
MADILVIRPHTLPLPELRGRIESLLYDLGREYGVFGRWEGGACRLTGAVIERGVIRLEADRVELEVDLLGMARMFKGKIEGAILERVEKVLA